MSRLHVPFAISLFLAALGCSPTGALNDKAEGDITRVPRKQDAPQRSRPLESGLGYTGTVQAVGADWVVLAPGWTGTKVDGVKQWNDEDTKTPKRFSAAGTPLLQVPKDPTAPISRPSGETHLVANLQVGDRVILMTGTDADGTQLLTEIKIQRRPGGKIPPMFGDRAVGTPYATHAREQSEQDWEEKGIPIPKKYLDPQGRAPWTNPPYPPAAPEPRPAKPKP